MSTLVQSLQDQIAYLRQEAEDWKEGARQGPNLKLFFLADPETASVLHY
jgi:hypothetical protein